MTSIVHEMFPDVVGAGLGSWIVFRLEQRGSLDRMTALTEQTSCIMMDSNAIGCVTQKVLMSVDDTQLPGPWLTGWDLQAS